MRALVTGGSGFVGSAVVRALLAQGTQVSCLVRTTSDRRNLEGLDLRFAIGDLGDADALRDALVGCDELYHVAAFYSTRPEDARRTFDINVDGTRVLLEAAAERGLKHIVHTSTIGTIGRPADGRLPTESDLFSDLGAASPYARSKLEGERIALSLAERGAPIVVVNPCAPVGARDIKPSSTGQRILDYLHGRAPSLSPGGINFVSVEDVAAGHLLAAERGEVGQRYILGHKEGNLLRADLYRKLTPVSGLRPPGEGSRLRSAVRRLRQAARSGPPEAVAQPGHQPSALTADPSRAIHELGLPQTPLDRAFTQAVIWFRENGYVQSGREPWG